MCGIVGYIGAQNATPIIVNGLKRLEYRGYDSAGVAVLAKNGKISVRRDAGKLERLQTLLHERPISGQMGIGHTRWATHGPPTQRNAHPHTGNSGNVVVVHNGIVENFRELKAMLVEHGITFNSDTDTEVIVHLVEYELARGGPLAEAARRAIGQLQGSHAVVVMSSDEPDKIIAARVGNAGGVVVGVGEDEMFLASDMPAILEYTRDVAFLEPGWITTITRDGFSIQTLAGEPRTGEVQHIPWDPVSAAKGEYRHFLQKEIHEQVRSLTDTMSGRIDFSTGKVSLPDLNLTAEKANAIRRIIITACGTAAYAGMVGKVLIEKLARISVEVSIASELRYADPIIGEGTVVLAISQSGETADTLAAMAEVKARGATLWSIVNAIGSQAMRIADGAIGMQTGPEISVASTKAFTAPLVDLYLLAMLLGDLRGTLSPDDLVQLAGELAHVPDLVSTMLDREDAIEQIAWALKEMDHCLYLGRGIQMPIAYEGALKLKEISYIHAEGYPAGEMKHGPIALIDEDMPTIAIAIKDPLYEKMLSQVEQAKARGGVVVALATDGDPLMAEKADHVIWIPECHWLVSPVVTTIPLQLLAYHIAVLRGTDVDQPRNLAKSVTVE